MSNINFVHIYDKICVWIYIYGILSKSSRTSYFFKIYLRWDFCEYIRPVVHGAMGCGQKRFNLVWWCHQLLSGFLAKVHLPRVSRQSSRSLMIRLIMKWSWGLCTDLLAFDLQLRKTPGKAELGDRLMKGMCDQSLPLMGPFSSKWGR